MPLNGTGEEKYKTNAFGMQLQQCNTKFWAQDLRNTWKTSEHCNRLLKHEVVLYQFLSTVETCVLYMYNPSEYCIANKTSVTCLQLLPYTSSVA